MMRDVTRVLMAEAALEYLRNDLTILQEHRVQIESEYLEQLTYFRNSIMNVRENFPEFVDRFETRMCSRAALIAAISEVDEYFHHGSITAKVYGWLTGKIQGAINNIPPISEPVPALESRKLIERVPLFTGLPTSVLDQVAKTAMPVNYLEGDIVIGTGSHGDALYIIDLIQSCIGKGAVAVKAVDKPEEFEVMQNYPNPFNPATEIQFTLPEVTHVKIAVYNILGQEVRVLVNEIIPGGYHTIQWDSRDNAGNMLSSGVYFYRMETEQYIRTHKMILLR